MARRRVARRRRKRRFQGRRRAPKQSAVTSKSSTGSAGTFFRARKLSSWKFRAELWRQTMFKPHYRSLGGTWQNQVTALNPIIVHGYMWEAMSIAFTPFWVAGGGARELDAGVTPPASYAGDIILRGGTLSVNVKSNADPGDPMDVHIFLIRRSQKPVAWVNPTALARGFETTIIPDWQQDVGRIVAQRKFILESGTQCKFSKRLRIQKLDQGAFFDSLGRYNWLIIVGNVGTTAINSTVTMTWNLAFSGDALT